MKKITLEQIQHHDTTLINIYRDFVVIEKEPTEESRINSRRKLASELVEYIENHILALENQVDENDEIERFQYITDRILFWKNILLHQFRVFYQPNIISAPKFFIDSSEEEGPHNKANSSDAKKPRG